MIFLLAVIFLVLLAIGSLVVAWAESRRAWKRAREFEWDVEA